MSRRSTFPPLTDYPAALNIHSALPESGRSANFEIGRPMTSTIFQRGLARVVSIRPGEGRALAWSFAYFFCLLAGYYVLRPLRDEMGIPAGEKSAVAVHRDLSRDARGGAAVRRDRRRFPRARFLPLVYHFFVANMAIFWLLLTFDIENGRSSRGFSSCGSACSTCCRVSVFWSFMADLYASEQGNGCSVLSPRAASAGRWRARR